MKPGSEMENRMVRQRFVKAYYVNLLNYKDRFPWLWQYFLDNDETHLGTYEIKITYQKYVNEI